MKENKLQEYIERANKKFNNRYDYSKSFAQTVKDKTVFICPIHGDFITTWDNHLQGCGCPKCSKRPSYTSEEWINEVSKIHNNKYDYSKTVYTKANEKVIVICNEIDEFGNKHGEFTIRAGNHMSGIGCPKCGNKYQPTTEEWIMKANFIHNNKYNYEKTKYIGSKHKVIITCPLHGDFEQKASSHILGCGCPKCNGGIALKDIDFINKSIEIHNNRYSYKNVKYINSHTKVSITCPLHGDFEQFPFQHLRGCGCPKCNSSKMENILIKLFQDENITYTYQYTIKSNILQRCDFYLDEYNIVVECQGEQHFTPINFSNNKDNNSYESNFLKTLEYDNNKYQTLIDKGIQVVYFTVPQYFQNSNVDINIDFYKDKNVFTHTDELLKFLKTQPKTINTSSFNLFFNDLYDILGKEIIKFDNNIVKYQDYVIIFQPLCKNECNNLNDLRRMYKKRNRNVLIIFEDEYLHKKEIVLNKILHITKQNKKEKIFGRKCEIKIINKFDANIFLEKNHIQGFVNSSLYLGAFNNNKLIGVMSFIKEKNDNWNLSRFATDINYNCVGVGGKLFTFFIKNFNFNEIKTFADKRWTFNEDSNLYTQLGFIKKNNLKPEYRYIDKVNNVRLHKFGFRKQLLLKKYPNCGLVMSMTEKEMTTLLGFECIWDCGLIKYIWKKEETT